MDFIKFLQNESGFTKRQAPSSQINPKTAGVFRNGASGDKEKKLLPAKNDFKKISVLLSDVLHALPNEKSKNFGGDHDDVSSEKWASLHVEAKTSIKKYLKAKKQKLKVEKRILNNERFLSDSWRFGLGATTAACLFLTFVLVAYAPLKTAEQIAFIDEVFFGFTNSSASNTTFFENRKNANSNTIDKNILASAKAEYIVKNSDKLKSGDIVRVIEDDLLGRVAGESEFNPSLLSAPGNLSLPPLPPLPPALPVSSPEKDSLFTEKYRDFIGRLKEKQDLLSRKMQEYLEGVNK